MAIIKRDGRPVEPAKQPVDPYAFEDGPELRQLAKRLDDAAKRREQQEQEAKTMPDPDTDDHDIRKRAADAKLSMDTFVKNRGSNVSAYTAMEQWRRGNPALFRDLNALPTPTPAPIAKASEHQVFFTKLCEEIRKRDGCDRQTAMERARTENPSSYQRLQGHAAG
jgi:hypothetical protein